MPAIVVHGMPPLSLHQQLSTGMFGASRVTPPCQPWRWQRVTQSLPTTLGKHNPPPRSLQHQLSTGMPRACQVTPSWQPIALPTGDPAYTTHVGDAQPSTEFIEVLAKLVQKQRVRVKQHLQVCVQAHQVHLRARHEKEWDERHEGQSMSHRSVAESIELTVDGGQIFDGDTLSPFSHGKCRGKFRLERMLTVNGGWILDWDAL